MQMLNLSVPLKPMEAGETQPSLATMGDTQVDSLNGLETQVFDQDTQPGLLEVHGTPATSEEDVQLAAMGWTIPKTCRPPLPATPKQLAPATAAVPAGGLPVPAEVPQKHGVLPATVVPSHANGMPAPATVPHEQVGSGQGSGVRAPATPQQVGNGQTGGLPAPATVPQQSGQTGGVPATVPQQVGSGLQTGGLPAPATVPQQVGSGQTGAPAAVPQQVRSGHGLLPPPATLPQQVGHDGQAGGLPAPATVPQQVGSGEIGGVPAPATVVPKQAPATVVPKQAPATGGLAAPATASSPGVSHEAQQAKAALPPAPALLQPHQVHYAPTTHVVPKVAMMPPPRVVPQQAQVGFAAPATHAAKSGMPAQPNKEEYSRRAAANLIKRLKDNPGRVEGMPSLKNMLHDESKKSELISLIVDNQGNLANVQAFLQVQEEVGKVQIARKKALRYTKKQMQDAYGEDAEAVMKFKEEQGLIDDDENNPNGKVYLIAAREDETENYHRNSNVMSTGRLQVTPENASDMAEIMQMPPPRAPAKRDAPATPTSSPSTPSAAPGTPAESVEEPRKKKQRKAEELYKKTQALITAGKTEEDDYIPCVREFLALQKNFEKPQAAGNAIARQQNKKPSAKAKAKNKA